MTSQEATTLARRYGIILGDDYHILTSSEMERVLAAADEWKYRNPKNANGSRGRYFYALLNRAAKRK